MRNAGKSEHDEQKRVILWLRKKRLLFCAVPNGGKRSKSVARRLWAEGVSPGVPDILIFDRPFHLPFVRGVAIEMKREAGGSISPEQAEWHSSLSARGWYVVTAQGADAAISTLVSLFDRPQGVVV